MVMAARLPLTGSHLAYKSWPRKSRHDRPGEDFRPLPLGDRKAKPARLLARASAGIVFSEHTDEDAPWFSVTPASSSLRASCRSGSVVLPPCRGHSFAGCFSELVASGGPIRACLALQ
jgi:hypothetical protein